MTGPYAAQWAAFRRRRNLARASFVASVPLLFALGGPLARHLNGMDLAYAVAAAWFALMLWTGMRVINWPCPRCHEPFLRGSFYHNAFARACLHCDLPKWADADPPTAAAEVP